MSSRLIWVALALCSRQGLRAQSLDDRRVGLFGGFTFADGLNVSTSNSRLGFAGGHLGFYVAQTRWLRWTGDVMIADKGLLGPTIGYVFAGPEFTKRAGRATFFGHSLFGYGSVDGNGFFSSTRSGFAMAFGGGVDVKLNGWLAVRPIQVDYLPSDFGGSAYTSLFGPPGPFVRTWENNVRVEAGIVFKFGHNP